MLLKIERTILYKLSKQPNEREIHINNFDNYSSDEIYHAMQSLMDKGYIETFTPSIDRSTFSYVLSTNGRFYREYLFRIFLRDIAIPIVISVITTLITLYITS